MTRVLVALALFLAALALATPASRAHVGEEHGLYPAQTLVPQSFGPVMPFPRRAEPPLRSVPRAQCRPGDDPEPGMQGRVTAETLNGPGKDGLFCNLDVVAKQGTDGGLKVRRYVDKAGNECAYYDSTLTYPLNAQSASPDSQGVIVLDMKDPRKPVKTAQLTTPAMLSPHESLVLSEQRGVLVAVMGNASTYPGIIDIYDVSADCRKPVLKSSTPTGVLGHESGLSPDGETFYSASPFSKTVVAVDISDTTAPKPLAVAQIASHGLSVSADGNRIYVAAVNTGTGASGLEIYDVSEVQARKPNPQMRKVSALTWETVSIPQNAIPITIKGRPYVLEIDEFRKTSGPRIAGAGRIIDISDEKKPFVVSDLRLEVNDPDKQAELANDPGQANGLQGYAGHYCDVPKPVDPEIVACSFILSGLRVFDIRDPRNPKEVAYYVAPPRPRIENQFNGSNYAMSAPSFNSARREVWYTDGNTGFYNLRLAARSWPGADGAPPAARGVDRAPGVSPSGSGSPGARRPCTSRRVIRVTTRRVRRLRRVERVVATARGKRVGLARRSRRVTLRFGGFAPGPLTVRLRITGRRADGTRVTVTQTRRYRLCVPR